MHAGGGGRAAQPGHTAHSIPRGRRRRRREVRGARRLEMCHTGARCAGCSSHAPVGAGSVSERGGSSTGGSSPDWTRSSNSLAGPSGKPESAATPSPSCAMMKLRLRSNSARARISTFAPSCSVRTRSPAAPPKRRSHFTSTTSRHVTCTTSLPWNPDLISSLLFVILYRVHACRASDAPKGMMPTTVRTDRPGMMVSVIEGAAS
mmetsp:Transcript_23532/g.78164  ORF Transcript_23532/g.78164 Transcript_23532/m.78164 type:complete len:205 (-) Transcript_23532:284-898(-)